MQIGKNKNLTAVAIGFFLLVAIAAITFYRSTLPGDNSATIDQAKPATTPDTPKKDSFELSAGQLADKLKSSQVPIIIDTRSPEEFKQEHILDSRNISLDDLQSEIAGLNRNTPYVIVDDGTGSGLSMTAEIFPKNNIKNVFYLAGGFPSWKNQNEQTISVGDPNSFADQAKVNYVKSDELKNLISAKNDLTIIDLRSSTRFNEGHLPGAINIFIDEIESRRKQIPIGKKIILYDKDGLWAFQGAVRLFEMGYFNVFCLSDGLDGWQKNNFELVK